MTNDTPPKPKRRRWRWLVVATLFLASLAAWMSLRPPKPNLDSRLIGEWRRGEMVRRFNADGTFEILGTPFPMTGVWSVEGNEIVLNKPTTARSVIGEKWNWFTSKFTGQRSISLRPPRYELIDVTTDKLRIKPVRPRPMTEEVYDRKQ